MLRRLRRARRIKIGDVLTWLVVALILAYVGLFLVHLSQGFNFTSALGGGVQDFRIFAICFGEWGQMQEFVARDSMFGDDLGKLAIELAGGECGPW